MKPLTTQPPNEIRNCLTKNSLIKSLVSFIILHSLPHELKNSSTTVTEAVEKDWAGIKKLKITVTSFFLSKMTETSKKMGAVQI